MKHGPIRNYAKETGSKSITGVMAAESSVRTQTIAAGGCFNFGTHPTLKPLSFWTPADTHRCLRLLPHSRIYDMGYPRTGCMFCCFGVHLNNPNKFQIMRETHPRIWEKALPALGITKVLDYMGVPYK